MTDCISRRLVVLLPLSINAQKKSRSLSDDAWFTTPFALEKHLYFKLKVWFIGRGISPYGDDDFMQKPSTKEA